MVYNYEFDQCSRPLQTNDILHKIDQSAVETYSYKYIDELEKI